MGIHRARYRLDEGHQELLGEIRLQEREPVGEIHHPVRLDAERPERELTVDPVELPEHLLVVACGYAEIQGAPELQDGLPHGYLHVDRQIVPLEYHAHGAPVLVGGVPHAPGIEGGEQGAHDLVPGHYPVFLCHHGSSDAGIADPATTVSVKACCAGRIIFRGSDLCPDENRPIITDRCS